MHLFWAIWLRAWVSGLGAAVLLALTVSGMQQLLARLYHETLRPRTDPPVKN